MLDRLVEKREDCLDEIEYCEKELERAKVKLQLLDEIIAEERARLTECDKDLTGYANDPLVGVPV
jgi:chromosome segregation ATPase